MALILLYFIAGMFILGATYKVAIFLLLGLLLADGFAGGEILNTLWCKIGYHTNYRIIGGAPFSDEFRPLDHCWFCGKPKAADKPPPKTNSRRCRLDSSRIEYDGRGFKPVVRSGGRKLKLLKKEAHDDMDRKDS